MTRPDLTISPVDTTDLAELRAVSEILHRALEGDRISQLITPPHLVVDDVLRLDRAVVARQRELRFPNPQILLMKACLDDGTMVAFAEWHRPLDRTSTGGHPLPDELARIELEKASPKSAAELDAELGSDPHFWEVLEREMAAAQRRVFAGKPFLYLHFLMVLPEHQGLGAGGRLLKEGLDRADAEGVPTYLEATDAGRPIYEAKGFITKDWVVIPDPGSEGGAIRLPGMVRAPRPASVS